MRIRKMCQEPLVSVIIPTYNRASFLVEAIGSVLAQTYSNLEVIVVDDGSSDGTMAAVEAIASRTARPVRYCWQHNQGASAARNMGLSMASGTFTAFCDSDDLWLPQKVEKQVAFLDENGSCDVVLCDLQPFGSSDAGWDGIPDLDIRAEVILDLLFQRQFASLVAALVRKEVFARVGGFVSGLEPSEDYDMFLRMAVGHRFGLIHERLAMFRMHEGKMTRRRTAFMQRYRTLRRFLRRNGRLVSRGTVRTRMLQVVTGIADSWLRIGRPGEALRYILESMDYGVPSAREVKNAVKALSRLVVS
ncbi:MAG: glycosyltransferase family A protein [Planctomycetota bacterium]|nr:glycosyltransferase family A protein [Planctomycetota bacterium]